MQTAAVFIFDDLVEHAHEAAAPFFPFFLPGLVPA